MSKLHRHLLMIGFIFLTCFFGYSQSVTVTGTVTDADTGDVLPGASIIVKGTSNGAITDFNGNFSINLESNKNVLIFSFLGYFSIEETVESRSEISIALTPNANELDEVVIIGYGTQIKKEITGAVLPVTSDDFKAQPVISSTDALQGRASGVLVGATKSLGNSPRIYEPLV